MKQLLGKSKALIALTVALMVFGAIEPNATSMRDRVFADSRVRDPAAVLPLSRLAPQHREVVSEVIRDHHFYRRGGQENFACSPDLYGCLLNQPVLTLGLWQDLAETPAKLRQIGTSSFEGSDGNGSSAVWEYVYRSPQLHVLYCNLVYTGPRQHVKLDGRVVLIVRSDYFRDRKASPWVRHDIEIFAKIDSKGWKAVAKAARPVIENLLDDQVQEAAWFISLMARMATQYPQWAKDAAMKRQDVAMNVRQQFCQYISQAQTTESKPGRPIIPGLTNSNSATTTVRSPSLKP